MGKQWRTPEDDNDLPLDEKEEEVPSSEDALLDKHVPLDEEEEDVNLDEEEDVQHAHHEDAYPGPSIETSPQSQDVDKQWRTLEDEDDLPLDAECTV